MDTFAFENPPGKDSKHMQYEICPNFRRLFNFILPLILVMLVVGGLLNTSGVSADLAATDCAAQTEIPQSECETLLALYNDTDGPNWSNAANNNWNVTNTPCSWYGVTCTDGHVTELQLNYYHLTGTIPTELANLSNLIIMNLSGNHLSSPIPVELSNLTNLQSLNLSYNQLSGAIPPELGQLANLHNLILAGNQLSGNVPLAITLSTRLSNLSLDYNGLRANNPLFAKFLNNKKSDWAKTQTVAPLNVNATNVSSTSIQINWQPLPSSPYPLHNTTKNGYYQVSYSLTSGGPYTPAASTTSDKFTKAYVVTGLQPDTRYYFVVQAYTPEHANNQNAINSTYSAETQAIVQMPRCCMEQTEIPQSECTLLLALYNATDGPNWANATTNNWKVDTPCNWQGVTCDAGHVTGIVLTKNHLNGPIPAELGNLAKLQDLNLSNNQLAGPIPAELGNLTSLQYLQLPQNQLSGSIPAELGNLNNLQSLGLYSNQLSGSIPKELGNLTNLQSLSLADNQLEGTIPAQLVNLTKLQSLSLSNNQLEDTIPAQLGNLTHLQNLNLSGNQLYEPIPEQLGNLINLQNLNLSNNQLNWGIPIELGNLTELQTLNLSSNDLDGSIPPKLGNLTKLQTLDLSSNDLDGSIPPELGNLTKLQTLDLSGNDLNHPIPSELGNLTDLSTLNLDYNHLSGSIPADLGNLTKLQELNLCDNHLSGPIPAQLGNLTDLSTLLLHNNSLTGNVPLSITQLTQLSCLRINNNGLSAGNPLVAEFLNKKSSGWVTAQIVAPLGINATSVSSTSIQINWQPLPLPQSPSNIGYSGYYQVSYSLTSGGPYTPATTTTENKFTSAYTVTELLPDTPYYFVVQMHSDSKNTNSSAYSAETNTSTLP